MKRTQHRQIRCSNSFYGTAYRDFQVNISLFCVELALGSWKESGLLSSVYVFVKEHRQLQSSSRSNTTSK